MRVKFKDMQENCRHQGWIKEGGVKMCSYKDRESAKCWADWQECKEQNCPLKVPKAADPPEEMEQLSFAPNGNISPCPWKAECYNHPAGCKGESYWCKRYD